MPLFDRVTYFFFHSLFSELPLRFHRMFWKKQSRERVTKISEKMCEDHVKTPDLRKPA